MFGLKLGRRQHFDRIPCQLRADPRADLTADTFIEKDLDGRDGDVVFSRRHRSDAVHRTEGNACLTARAVVLIHNGHQFWLLFLFRDLGREVRDAFIVVVRRVHR